MRFKDKKQIEKHLNMNKLKNICNKCNCDFVGIMEVPKSNKKLVLFNDKVFHTTLTVYLHKFSYNEVMKKLTELKEKTGVDVK